MSALINNESAQRYEMVFEDQTAFIDYRLKPGKIYLIHTEVPENLRGQDIGTDLVKAVLDDLQAGDRKLIPSCPFVAAYIKRHPEYQALTER